MRNRIITGLCCLFVCLGAAQNPVSKETIEAIELRVQPQQDAVTKAYHASIFVKGVAEYPYPKTEDPINRLLGRRAAVVYAYKRLQNVIARELSDFVSHKEIMISADGYIYKARVIRSRFTDNVAGVIVELPLQFTTKDRLVALRHVFEDRYNVIETDNIAVDYDGRVNPISIDFWEKRIRTLDERYVDKSVYDAIE